MGTDFFLRTMLTRTKFLFMILDAFTSAVISQLQCNCRCTSRQGSFIASTLWLTMWLNLRLTICKVSPLIVASRLVLTCRSVDLSDDGNDVQVEAAVPAVEDDGEFANAETLETAEVLDDQPEAV